jgi:hypothetical protein
MKRSPSKTETTKSVAAMAVPRQNDFFTFIKTRHAAPALDGRALQLLRRLNHREHSSHRRARMTKLREQDIQADVTSSAVRARQPASSPIALPSADVGYREGNRAAGKSD